MNILKKQENNEKGGEIIPFLIRSKLAVLSFNSKKLVCKNISVLRDKGEKMNINLKISRDPVFVETGYKELTTFWSDFTIADAFGKGAIVDTYNSGFKYAKTDYKVLTEFVMVLNHKLWQHFESSNINIAKVYDTLWKKADAYARNNLKGKELEYFYRTTD